MYAIVEIAGKQYKIEKDAKINVEKLDTGAEGTVVIDKILLYADGVDVLIGQPYLKNVNITAKVLDEVKGDKVRGIKFGKRKRHERTLGHRQTYSRILISELTVR
ncbi:MAG: 50S ribosomal protein L21 [Spirochaetes bacterium RBG_13_51_14]|nr:MAG: 50S ribosomal protein L21 [Spirochaetes bacterium RBG_13_51_14]